MKAILMAAAAALAFSGAALAADKMDKGGGSANPAEKGVTTPKQPNETQPGLSGDKGKGKGMKGESQKGAGAMKSDTMSGGTSMSGGGSSSMSGSGSSNVGNPAEKGSRTPSQPNDDPARHRLGEE